MQIPLGYNLKMRQRIAAFFGRHSLVFDGVDEQLRGGDWANFERNDVYSVFARINTTGGGTIASRRDVSPKFRGWQFSVSSGVLRLIHGKNAPVEAKDVRGNDTVNDGSCHDVMVTVSASSAASSIKMWVDGDVQVNTVLSDDADTDIAALNAADFMIGATEFGANFDGNIDKVIVWDVQVSDSDAADITAMNKMPEAVNSSDIIINYNSSNAAWDGSKFTAGVTAGTMESENMEETDKIISLC